MSYLCICYEYYTYICQKIICIVVRLVLYTFDMKFTVKIKATTTRFWSYCLYSQNSRLKYNLLLHFSNNISSHRRLIKKMTKCFKESRKLQVGNPLASDPSSLGKWMYFYRPNSPQVRKRENIRPCNHSNKQGVYVKPASLNYPLKLAGRGTEQWAGHRRLMDR